jgi:hypothetical protein
MLPSKVFISYRHEDGSEAAGALDTMVRRAGVEVLRDTCFAHGDNLDAAVLERLASAELVLFLVTPLWTAGDWVRRELRFVRAVGKKALHVFLGAEDCLKPIKESSAFLEVWGSGDAEYKRYLEYFPWLTVDITRASEIDRVLVHVLRAFGRVPMVDWPRSNQFLPLRQDLPDKFLCLTEKGLCDAGRDLMPGHSAVVTTTSRGFDLHGEVSTGVCSHFRVQPKDLIPVTRAETKAPLSQARGYHVSRPLTESDGRQFFLIGATAFAKNGNPQTSESLQQGAVHQALKLATEDYGCQAVLLPLFGTGPNVGLPVHQGIRAVLSAICSFMWTHDRSLIVVLSVPTSGAGYRERHIQHALNYVRFLAQQEVPRLLSTQIRFRLRGSPEHDVWMSRSQNVRQLAMQLLGERPESLDPRTRCYAWAGNSKVAPRSGNAEPYRYGLDTKIGDMVFSDCEIVSFEPDS